MVTSRPDRPHPQARGTAAISATNGSATNVHSVISETVVCAPSRTRGFGWRDAGAGLVGGVVSEVMPGLLGALGHLRVGDERKRARAWQVEGWTGRGGWTAGHRAADAGARWALSGLPEIARG